MHDPIIFFEEGRGRRELKEAIDAVMILNDLIAQRSPLSLSSLQVRVVTAREFDVKVNVTFQVNCFIRRLFLAHLSVLCVPRQKKSLLQK